MLEHCRQICAVTISKAVNFSTALGRNPHLLLEDAKFVAGITRNQYTVYS
jgi:hypothetical protein